MKVGLLLHLIYLVMAQEALSTEYDPTKQPKGHA
uniref:Uncharacterized protein n=1 Tax=Rhizophora mucronata TaxID=61149 RepID=A0A2P2N7Z9_RHIMU